MRANVTSTCSLVFRTTASSPGTRPPTTIWGTGFLARLMPVAILRGDWGATFSLDREFNNGFRVGGYFTLTDVSSEDFGEGSFDKGIRFEVPLSWLMAVRPKPRSAKASVQFRGTVALV